MLSHPKIHMAENPSGNFPLRWNNAELQKNRKVIYTIQLTGPILRMVSTIGISFRYSSLGLVPESMEEGAEVGQFWTLIYPKSGSFLHAR
jgi:hypothetical protein